MKKNIYLALALSLLAGISAVHAQAATQRIAGVLLKFDKGTLQIKTAKAERLSIALAPDARILVESPASFDDITPDMYLGVTAVPQKDGVLNASQIRIFPEALRGTGEGHRVMDGPNAGTLTNAKLDQVSAPASNTMTNASVLATSQAGDERLMHLRYKGGQKTVKVPAGVVVIQTEIGEAALLKPGVKLVVSASTGADGRLSGNRVTVGKNGSAPH